MQTTFAIECQDQGKSGKEGGLHGGRGLILLVKIYFL